MMYLILRTQEGEGCDYTIGCGRNWTFFESENTNLHEVAIEVASELGASEFNPDSEFVLEKLQVIQVAAIGEIDLEALWKGYQVAQRHIAKERAEEEERAEYERLRGKFGN